MERNEKIAAENDKARRFATACKRVLTPGVAALDHDTRFKLVGLVAKFDDFTEDNDPYGEHDFGAVELDGVRYFWKIDYYADASLTYGAEDPAGDCVRVLTYMRADEY